MKRIIVVGVTSSGKSTLSQKLAKQLKYPHIQLDQLFWKKNWTESADQEFFRSIELATHKPHWIVDGNYARTNHITWPLADTVIWINLPLWVTLYQNITRSIKRAVYRKELWPNTGNKESLTRMFSKDSIVLWLFKTYSSNKKRYAKRLNDPLYSHINFIKLRSHKEIRQFLKTTDTGFDV